MSFLKWSKFFILCVLLLLVSNLYGSDFISGLLKFQDLLLEDWAKHLYWFTLLILILVGMDLNY